MVAGNIAFPVSAAQKLAVALPFDLYTQQPNVRLQAGHIQVFSTVPIQLPTL